jgi:hypothetical protein
VVLDNLWLGQEEGEAIAAALVPKLQKTKVAVEQLLFEVATLEVGPASADFVMSSRDKADAPSRFNSARTSLYWPCPSSCCPPWVPAVLNDSCKPQSSVAWQRTASMLS